MTDETPEDPITALAAAATGMHELFTAYIDAGFTRAEALQILIAVVTAPMRPLNPGGAE